MLNYSPPKIKRFWSHPLGLLLIVILLIFLVEFLLMLFFGFAQLNLTRLEEGLLDAAFLVIFLFPLLYWFVVRPLLLNMKQLRSQAQAINNLAKFPTENPFPVLRISKTGRLIFANRACQKDLPSWSCGVAECVPDGFKAVIDQAVSQKEIREIEVVQPNKIFLFSIVPVANTDYINAYALDITDRKKFEQQLIDSNNFNKSLLQTIPFPMDIVDEQGHLLFINEEMKSRLNRDISGKRCWEMYKDNKRPCEHCPLVDGIAIGETKPVEAKGCFGGRTFRIYHTGMLYHDQKAILEIFIDVTEQKEIEERLRELYQAKTEFTSMVSHELRTPLNAIKQGVGVVADGTAGQLNAEQKDFLELSKRNIDRLNRLINDVLKLSKLEAGKLDFALRQANLVPVIREVVKSQLKLAENKNLTLQVDFNQDKLMAIIDEDRITQVLTNLINNAIKFTENGGIKVSLQEDQARQLVKVCVIDSGPGILPKDQALLFEKFRQLGGLEGRKTGGTGLGLAISKEIIEHHHGTIWVESEIGQGSKFCFTLPLAEKENQDG